MQKERLFYLDFVRAIGTILIILTHYNALFLFNSFSQNKSGIILTADISNVYIGSVGVSLFLIVSGAALTYVYENKEMKVFSFYKKRLSSIYPIFWIGYILAFCITFCQNHGIQQGIPRKNIIFSILGIDTYLANYGVATFALVGEWFIGLILMIYILFPLLLKLFNSHPVILGMLTVILYCISVWKIDNNIDLFKWLPHFIFGMYFARYIKKVDWEIAIICFFVIIFNKIKNLPVLENIKVMYIGISVFVVLVFLSKYMQWEWNKKICGVICKYSYACFVIHHFVIYQITQKFDLAIISRTNSACLFLVCCIAIAISSWLLYQIYVKIANVFKRN